MSRITIYIFISTALLACGPNAEAPTQGADSQVQGDSHKFSDTSTATPSVTDMSSHDIAKPAVTIKKKVKVPEPQSTGQNDTPSKEEPQNLSVENSFCHLTSHEAMLGTGPNQDTVDEAALAGILPPGANIVVVGTVAHRRDHYVVFRTMGVELYRAARRCQNGKDSKEKMVKERATVESAPPSLETYIKQEATINKREALSRPHGAYLYAIQRERMPRFAFWLARVTTSSQGETVKFKREWARRLIDMVTIGSSKIESENDPEWRCSRPLELKVRDLDGDGEDEVKLVIPAGATRLEVTDRSECGATAFLVGADGAVQASFTREYKWEKFSFCHECTENIVTTWRLKDLNGDGHDDLHVVERMRGVEDVPGDYIGGGQSISGYLTKCADKIESDCLYDPEGDIWKCNDPGPPGQILLRSPKEIISPNTHANTVTSSTRKCW